MSTSFFIVACPCGEREYPVDPAKVPEEGVHARCSSCSAVFMVERPRWASPDAGGGGEGGGAGAPAGSSEAHDNEVFDAYFEPVYPDEGGEGISTVVDTGVADQAQQSVAAWEIPASPPPPPPSDVGLRVEVEVPGPPPGGVAFGRRDPHDKARRLARVLVSDMITYHRERHSRALGAGTLPEDFDEEIRKSWDEYVQQVGKELAEGTTYFRDALNDILAGGRDLF
jgi:hypothetical protein